MLLGMQQIVAGEYQIVILSPEMLLSRRFVDGVLRKPEFGSRCLSIFIDEAHCVSHWGSGFRKKYSSIGIARAFLPKGAPMVAASATLTARVRDDIIDKLHFRQDHLFVNIGNDRANVAQVVRSIEHPMSSYRDLDFLIPQNITLHEDIPKTFLYCDTIKDGAQIVDYLNSLVPEHYREYGLVRPYNAAMSQRYRKEVMELFNLGYIRVLVCTDAAGMVSLNSIYFQHKLTYHYAGLQYPRCRHCHSMENAARSVIVGSASRTRCSCTWT